MRVRRLAAATALSGAAVIATAPLASAVEAGAVVVSPGSAAPGQTVTIGASGCATANPNATARAYSNAFPTTALNAVGSTGEVAGSTQVFSGAKAGTYTVTVVCDVSNPSQKATGSLTVVTSATGGATTGDGATQSFPTSSVAGGAALAAGSLGLGAFALRRRAGGRA
ncbi:hypothetical protein [Streptacidiphilus jiangxiensis]|uniref:Gram-positive cocci surface proteins LPxTG domain-containing protein n=1 Tax=Streptacidiphilus jiangxiensis TaxID=235985 RepID=A0A1H7JNS5_STRJI|nr:hypothetical protein [Streptacidiphilus jiangxiensis]SEK76251.1 hypothetical protein SAMN05414137_103387 [Streptacidiphilus jiangxiensis]